MKKKKKDIKKLIDEQSNTFVDKLAKIKFATKRDSKLLSSVVSSVLKKNSYFSITKKQQP